MRSWMPWVLCGAIAFLFAGVVPAAAQEGWDEEDAMREKNRAREEAERREREEMERRKHEEGERRGQKDGDQPRPGGPGGFGPGGGPGAPGAPGVGPDGRMMKQPMPRARITEEQQQQALAWLKEFEPDRLAKLEHVQRENPEMYLNLLMDTYWEMKKVQELKSRDPDGYDKWAKERKLDLQVRQLSEKYRKLEDEAQKAEVRSELQVLLSQLFDLRETMREREVKELEKRLTELRQTLEKRRANKVMIVENRLKQLLGEKEHLDW